MSANIFKHLTIALRINFLRHPVKTARLSTSVDMATTEETDLVANKNRTRYKGRFLKRQWDEPNPNKKVDGETDEKKACDQPTERIKKKKMAMLLGYSGVDYFGMQRNPGVRTIEEDLMKALLDAKYITEDDFNNQQNAQFQRSSRTDKGVSAARQVVSLKLPLDANIDEINKRLPQESIKVFAIQRVTNKFNSKTKSDARTYSYTLPTYVFEPRLIEMEERKKYRITEEKLKEVNDILEVYKGTKSYHNFTEKKYYTDPSASRYMMSFAVDKVFVDTDMEFAVLLVKGQSFMLHQIRKMVGLMIAVVRGHTDRSTLEKAFGRDKVMIPTAPGLGLVLDQVHFTRYDAKFKDSHSSLSWEGTEDAVAEFTRAHIHPHITRGEREQGCMGQWVDGKLAQHSYEPPKETADPSTEPIGESTQSTDESSNSPQLAPETSESPQLTAKSTNETTQSAPKSTDPKAVSKKESIEELKSLSNEPSSASQSTHSTDESTSNSSQLPAEMSESSQLAAKSTNKSTQSSPESTDAKAEPKEEYTGELNSLSN